MALTRTGVALVAAAVMLSGCETSNLIPERFRSQQASQAKQTSANAEPAESASRSSDEDAAGSETEAEQALLTGASSEQAANQPSSRAIGRADLLGGWKVTSGDDNCQLFMSLTGWAGGYRAITKGCSLPVLTGVEAWTLNGEEIALLSGSGDTVIRLTASDKTRLSGKTTDGQSVMVFR